MRSSWNDVSLIRLYDADVVGLMTICPLDCKQQNPPKSLLICSTINQARFLPHPPTNHILRTFLPFLKAGCPLPFVSAVASEGTEQLPAQPSNPAAQSSPSSFPGRTTTLNPMTAPTSASTSMSGTLAQCSPWIPMVPNHAPSVVMLTMAQMSAPETSLLNILYIHTTPYDS